MPGTPPVSPRFSAPRYIDDDTASFSAQLNSVTDVLDAKAALLTDPRFTDQRVPTDGSVGTAKIANGAVTPAKLSDPNAVLQPGDFIWSAAALRSGSVLADGSLISTTGVTAALAAAIGTVYNTGGESAGYVRLPDLRGRLPMGAGAGSGLSNRVAGQYVGSETVSLTSAQNGPHTHTMDDPGHSHAVLDLGHAHGINDMGHAHSVFDPGHAHTIGYDLNAYGAAGGGTADPDSRNPRTYSSGRSTTGVQVAIATTGISVVAATTGVLVQGAQTGISTIQSGSGASHSNVPPSVVGYWHVKL